MVPYPGGGSADLPARMLADRLQRKFGKPFIVENRAGAAGQIGTEAARLDVMLDNIHFPQIRQGQVKMLGVLGARRHPEFPNVPTFAEQGFPIDLRVWGGFMAPVGTPQDIIDTLGRR